MSGCELSIRGPGRQLVNGLASNGSIIAIVGSFEGPTDLGGGALGSAGATDVFVAVYDMHCRHLASRSFSGPGSEPTADGAADVAIDAAGNIAVVGHASISIDLGGGVLRTGATDGFVASYDASLTHRWSRLARLWLEPTGETRLVEDEMLDTFVAHASVGLRTSSCSSRAVPRAEAAGRARKTSPSASASATDHARGGRAASRPRRLISTAAANT